MVLNYLLRSVAHHKKVPLQAYFTFKKNAKTTPVKDSVFLH